MVIGYLAKFSPGYLIVQICAICIENVWGLCHWLLHNANIQAVSHCCQYKFSPKHTPIKTRPQAHWPKSWTSEILWAISNKLLSFWNLKIAVAGLEILEKRYITLMYLYYALQSLKYFHWYNDAMKLWTQQMYPLISHQFTIATAATTYENILEMITAAKKKYLNLYEP